MALARVHVHHRSAASSLGSASFRRMAAQSALERGPSGIGAATERRRPATSGARAAAYEGCPSDAQVATNRKRAWHSLCAREGDRSRGRPPPTASHTPAQRQPGSMLRHSGSGGGACCVSAPERRRRGGGRPAQPRTRRPLSPPAGADAAAPPDSDGARRSGCPSRCSAHDGQLLQVRRADFDGSERSWARFDRIQRGLVKARGSLQPKVAGCGAGKHIRIGLASTKCRDSFDLNLGWLRANWALLKQAGLTATKIGPS